MQRIKSQSTCNAHSIAITSQSRPRSKKNSKPLSSQIVYCNADRIKHSQGNISQNSMVSVKSHSKLLAGSTKNLRTGPYQNIGKSSVQNTTRGVSGQNSAISARILKQIVGYSHRGVSGSKVQHNDDQHFANKQQIRLKIDLDQQIRKVYKKQQEDQPRTTLSQDRHQSYTTSYKKSQENQQSSNKKKQINITKGNKNKPRAIKQFQPIGIAYQNQAKLKFNNQEKKYSFFNSIYQECIQGGSSQLYQLQNRSIIGKANQLSKMSNLTIQNYSKEEEIQNNHDITENFIKINSPHCNNIPRRQKQAQNFATNKPQKQLYLNKQNNRKISNKMNRPQLKLMKNVNIYEEDCENKQQEALIQEKQKLIINLQQSNVLLEQHYQFKYKQIIPFWKSLIESQIKQNQIQEQINKLQLSLKQYQIKDLAKKTQLFQLNRDQLCRKKQKQYATRSSKQKYLQQAISCQQALKLKLSSKADYEHVVLFNQKVILSGQSSFDDLNKIFVQMFENKLSKKFALIAKKQLANLSVYDSRLVQDFLKRIQQLESLHNKSEMNTAANNPSQSNICHYSSVTEQQRLEILIEEIQQLILNIECINSKMMMKKSQLSDLQAKIKQCTRIMQKQIKNKNKIISEQYKMAEGCSFDFQELLQEKYDKQFQQYRKELSYRNQIIKSLYIIERKITQCRKSKQYESANESEKNSQKSFRKQPNRNSVSFVTTPTNRSPLRIQKDYRANQVQIQQNTSGRMFKKSIHAQ